MDAELQNTDRVREAVAAGRAKADAWEALRRFTDARIALGRAGGSLRTEALLDFRLAHAEARDAVYTSFDPDALVKELAAAKIRSVRLTSAATNKADYLANPALGRTLSDASRKALSAMRYSAAPPDLCIIVSDGLSARAAQLHAVETVVPLTRKLADVGWSLAPVFVVPFARVKIQDEVGERLRARITLMFLGERPGLDSPDSLGAYFTYSPNSRSTDADRNCVSNIRHAGLAPTAAAGVLFRMLVLSRRLSASGVAVKDTEAQLK
ncbi:MAG: ethanolamine ammonia-lyase subunit EutC [Acidobacteriota bacterium]|jgi:ethanolamine ammonia-lyase small subunit|nr:ethanolamine ammonia-lyase subunit EutC [Acidobacteriota bacterium]